MANSVKWKKLSVILANISFPYALHLTPELISPENHHKKVRAMKKCSTTQIDVCSTPGCYGEIAYKCN